jgi:iron(III) transport system substrate-binding protein
MTVDILNWRLGRHRTKWSAALLLATMGVFLAACSSSSSSNGASGSSTSASATGAAVQSSTASSSAVGGSAPGSSPAASSSSDWDSVVAAANQEGQVTLYTNFPTAQTNAKVAAFNQVYPKIKVNVLTDATATLPARYQQERQSTGKSPADVTESSVFEPLIASNPDWFTTLTPDVLPSISQFKSIAVTSSGKSIMTDAYTWEIVYNTSLVSSSDMPTTWADLLSSKWTGKIIALDPRGSSSYMAIFDELHSHLGSTFSGFTHVTFTQSSTDLGQKVAAGAYAIGIYTNPSKLAPLLASGAPLKTLQIAPDLMGFTTMSLPTDAPHPNAARLLANFLLSPQGQEVQCKAADLGSLNNQAQGACTANAIPSDAIALPLTTSSADQAAILSALNLKQ